MRDDSTREGGIAELETLAQEAVRDREADHAAIAALAEEAGRFGLAFRHWLLAARARPDDPAVLLPLARAYEEQGDVDRAFPLLESVLAREPANIPALETMARLLPPEGRTPRLRELVEAARRAGIAAELVHRLEARAEIRARESETDLPVTGEVAVPSAEEVQRFLALFAGREGVHARQWFDPARGSGYTPVHAPLSHQVAMNHLLGNSTVGIYLLRVDNTVALFALDLDVRRKALEEARRDAGRAAALRDEMHRWGIVLRDRLAALGLPALLENSGYKGRHLWVFLESPMAAGAVHLFGRLLLPRLAPDLPGALSVEFFPKQAKPGKEGLGNLIKLPLGLHRVSGRPSSFLDERGDPVIDPWPVLRGVPRLSPRVVEDLLLSWKAETPAVSPRPEAGGEDTGDAGGAARSLLGPPPPEPPPAWTEADFETHPAIRHLFASCAVLDGLRKKVHEHRRLSHDEQIVLKHTLGHHPEGLLAANWLLARCLDIPSENLLKSRLAGSPISCPKIRQRIPHITSRVPCNCPFPFAPDHYPTPVLHLSAPDIDGHSGEVSPPQVRPVEDLERLARRYGAALDRLRALEGEVDDLGKALMVRLAALPDPSVPCPGGVYRLHVAGGVSELRWESNPPAAPDAGGAAARTGRTGSTRVGAPCESLPSLSLEPGSQGTGRSSS
ncbi:MAG: hypothetical protein HY720_03400 [Planctomycetes bacterium]|nr:hypothetical protein [Planctomycetota bacterium]